MVINLKVGYWYCNYYYKFIGFFDVYIIKGGILFVIKKIGIYDIC